MPLEKYPRAIVALLVAFASSTAQAQRADRGEALERFKQHFLKTVRELFSNSSMNAPPGLKEMLGRVERDGPSQMELSKFTDLFKNASVDDLAEACQHAAKDIGDRIRMEELLSESARKLQQMQPERP